MKQEKKDYSGRYFTFYISIILIFLMAIGQFSCKSFEFTEYVDRVEVTYTNGDKELVYIQRDENEYEYLNESGCLCSIGQSNVSNVRCQVRSFKVVSSVEIVK